MQRAAAALLLGLLGIGVARQFDFGTTRNAGAGSPAAASPIPETAPAIPTLPPAALAESEFTLESPATEVAMSMLPPEPLIGEPLEFAGQLPGNPNQIVWKPITSRRGR